MRRCAIVLTSIYDNNWIERVTKHLAFQDRLCEVDIIFIGDLKTPAALYEKISDARKFGMKIIAPTFIEQKKLEQQWGFKKNFIAENSDHRRNIGYVLAWLEQYDFVISMDDDNFPGSGTFADEHMYRLGLRDGPHVDSSSGVFNNLTLLERDTIFNPRGFPFTRKDDFSQRHEKYTIYQDRSSVGANGGLWTGSPDVDAMSWLTSRKQFDSGIALVR